MTNTRKTICLNMIVKDESHVIEKTLENVCDKINIDYWVIADTGSKDNTKEIINDFFTKRSIKGELYCDTWKNFGYNRSLALEYAYNKSDYVLVFDADDVIVGDLIIPDNLCMDSYKMQYSNEYGETTYVRRGMLNNRIKWKYEGVLHEYSYSNEAKTEGLIEGNYYIISGRTGARSKDPDKYKKDAKMLEEGFNEEIKTHGKVTDLATRYAFYCGQSYKDCNDTENAIKWYKKVATELNNWTQEKYCACYYLGLLYDSIGDIANTIKYYLMGSEYDPTRIECAVRLAEIMRAKNFNIFVPPIYELHKNYGDQTNNSNKLFVQNMLYKNKNLEYECSISGYYVKGKEQMGYECCKKIINSVSNDTYIYKQTIANLMTPKYMAMLKNDTKTDQTNIINKMEQCEFKYPEAKKLLEIMRSI